MTSIFLTVAKTHFTTVRPSYDQPHTIAAQLNFLRRSKLGPATFTVTEAKLGSRTSTLYITLTQGDSLPIVVGFFTQSNIEREEGISLPTPHELTPPRPRLRSTQGLRDGTDPEWTLFQNPFQSFRKASQHLAMYLPRQRRPATTTPGLIDLWLTMPGQRFTQESLGYVIDSFPQMVEMADPPPPQDLQRGTDRRRRRQQIREGDGSSRQSEHSGSETTASGGGGGGGSIDRALWAKFWYPTVLLNLEVKKTLPPEGAEWLYSRVTARQIRNGRMDLQIVVLDEEGELVALSNHVALIVPAQRNMKRGTMARGGEGSKL